MNTATPIPTFLTKPGAAEYLGVSLSTFDRIRKRMGIAPAPSPRLKPILFARSSIEALMVGLREPPGRDGILSLREIKRRAKREGGR